MLKSTFRNRSKPKMLFSVVSQRDDPSLCDVVLVGERRRGLGEGVI